MKSDRSGDTQYAALPWRREAGRLQVMLITSRETQRWVIPKGWPMQGIEPAQAAAVEAYEEAGLRGQMGPAIGAYSYGKRQKDQSVKTLTVEVFPMEVDSEMAYWPEARQRRRRWFDHLVAAEAVDELELTQIIRQFNP
ncbi:MAG: NUDIX hydrolase [Caulobacteraceae bacterium]|nr:MAG: NUDIX hydrolase [Caulobacteraceae bacterium]